MKGTTWWVSITNVQLAKGRGLASRLFNVLSDATGLPAAARSGWLSLRVPRPNKTLVKYAYVPLIVRPACSATPADQQKLAKRSPAARQARPVLIPIMSWCQALSSKVFTTVADDVDRLSSSDSRKPSQGCASADALIPTPVAGDPAPDYRPLCGFTHDNFKQEVLRFPAYQINRTPRLGICWNWLT